MALESATYISGLVAANPPGTDAISQGDDHIRLIKSVLKSTLPNADEAINGIHTGTSEPSPNTAGQLWFDTSGDGVLKVRNKADSGWDNVGAGKLLAVSHNYRSGYTDISSTTMTDSGLSLTYTKLSATSTLYVDVMTPVYLAAGWNDPSDPQSTMTGYMRLVYATSTTTGIVPSTSDNVVHLKENGLDTVSGTVQIGFGSGYLWKITGLAIAAYTFKVQGKVSNDDGNMEFVDGTIRLMEVEA
tara:strand:+ start:291 stop:1022 length:732 start_codon:yes stop_codon:yes gene_type:complete